MDCSVLRVWTLKGEVPTRTRKKNTASGILKEGSGFLDNE